MEKTKKRYLVKGYAPGKKSPTERQCWAESAEEAEEAYIKLGFDVISVWEGKIYTKTSTLRVRVVE